MTKNAIDIRIKEVSYTGGLSGLPSAWLCARRIAERFVLVHSRAHFIGVSLGNGDDVAGGPADTALVAVHAAGLEFEVGAAQWVGGVLDVAAPDHGFDIVLEKDGMRQVGEVTGGGEVIDDGAIEAFPADEVFEEGTHAGRMEALDGNGGCGEETADQLGIKRGAGFGI